MWQGPSYYEGYSRPDAMKQWRGRYLLWEQLAASQGYDPYYQDRLWEQLAASQDHCYYEGYSLPDAMKQWRGRYWLWEQLAASQWYDPYYQEQQNAEEETKERLLKMKEDLESVALDKLQNALNIAKENEIETEITTCIERAILFLDYEGNDSTPRGALDALRQTTQALDMCGHTTHSEPLYTELDAAAKKVRDSLSVRTQLIAPMGDKEQYQSVLEAAYGGRIDDEENSRLMQSYRKTIWEQFPNAFPSNNKKEGLTFHFAP